MAKKQPKQTKQTEQPKEPVNATVAALDEISKKYGEGAIQIGRGTFVKVEAISTGLASLDVALGCGGLPRGRFVEIYGMESGGKTTLALHCIAACQSSGFIAAFIDAEHALDPLWAEHIGVDLDKLIISQPDSGVEALDIVETLTAKDAADLVVVDSVAALIPPEELEGDISDVQVGAQARLMSKSLRKLSSKISKSRVCVVFINQLRDKIGGFSMPGMPKPEITPGGRALKFYASVRMEVKKSGFIDQGKRRIGARARVKVVKNKVAPPFRDAEFEINFGDRGQIPLRYGMDTVLSLLDGAVEVGVIERRGSNYYFGEQKLGNSSEAAVANLRMSDLSSPTSLFCCVYDEVQKKLQVKVEASAGQPNPVEDPNTGDSDVNETTELEIEEMP